MDSNSQLVLEDRSVRQRMGIRGEASSTWLEKNQYDVDDQPNSSQWQRDGSLVGRLSLTELLWLSGPDDSLPPAGPDFGDDFRCYPVARRDSHCWFVLSGCEAATMLSKICGVDLSPDNFADLRIAQTSVSRVGAIVIRADMHEQLCFHILVDSSYAAYFWETLVDAGTEFELRVVVPV